MHDRYTGVTNYLSEPERLRAKEVEILPPTSSKSGCPSVVIRSLYRSGDLFKWTRSATTQLPFLTESEETKFGGLTGTGRDYFLVSCRLTRPWNLQSSHRRVGSPLALEQGPTLLSQSGNDL